GGGRNLNKRHCHGGSQKFEDYRYGGRRGHANGIEEVQQQDVRDHYGHKDDHQLIEHTFAVVKDPLSCYLHHTTAENGPNGDPKAGYDPNGPKRYSFGADRGV